MLQWDVPELTIRPRRVPELAVTYYYAYAHFLAGPTILQFWVLYNSAIPHRVYV
jgi:hypothetical protein